MSNLQAVVRNGRIVLDEPTELPEGTVLDLVVDDGGDSLDDEERRALHASLERSMAQAKAGRTRAAENFLEELRSRAE
jgi:hypothetical protein